MQYSLAYACLKLVNYSFFFWLPFYLSNNYGWKEAEADRLSVWYDVGGIVGSPNDKLINAVILATTGFFIGGPSNMISSAISADLGRQDVLRGSQEALATVTGIVDGTGSIGAAVGQNFETCGETGKLCDISSESPTVCQVLIKESSAGLFWFRLLGWFQDAEGSLFVTALTETQQLEMYCKTSLSWNRGRV
ncbi:hypothetical protein GOODEAATRI_024709 [Goodea atripinnis]|uniref:Uncharacterized protein n=1 Tax=Goodea atripinnis TaxID=208336 RepID=A0ABV0MKG4_9TELE